MKVHCIGHGCAGISFLHAAGCGTGGAVPIDLETTVMLTDVPTPIPEDESRLLDLLLEGWSSRNLSLPQGKLGWSQVRDPHRDGTEVQYSSLGRSPKGSL